MSPLFVAGILLALLLYIILFLFAIKDRAKYNETQMLLKNNHESKVFTFDYENKVINYFHLKPEKVKIILYIERLLLIILCAVIFITLKGLAIALFGAIFVSLLFRDLYKKCIYKSGINNIGKITNFIDYFVPHINAGNSADQSFLEYIEYSRDVELASYFENKDSLEVKIPPHLKQIIDIYDIAKYNEEKGINDYTYILNEISQDISQKQTYYNNFISRIGEIQPICFSYYIGVPILIAVSYSNTYTFWQAGGGYVVAAVLLILFTIFKFLIYKLQKKTIETIF